MPPSPRSFTVSYRPRNVRLAMVGVHWMRDDWALQTYVTNRGRVGNLALFGREQTNTKNSSLTLQALTGRNVARFDRVSRSAARCPLWAPDRDTRSNLATFRPVRA